MGSRGKAVWDPTDLLWDVYGRNQRWGLGDLGRNKSGKTER